MDFIFYFLVIIALFIGVFVNIANLKEQIWVLQTQLTELQKHLLSFTQQHYLSNKANVEEESYTDQTSTEPIVNNNPDTQNKNKPNEEIIVDTFYDEKENPLDSLTPNQSTLESIICNNLDIQNKNNSIGIKQSVEITPSMINTRYNETENSSESLIPEIEVIQPLSQYHQESTFLTLELNEKNDPIVGDSVNQTNSESATENVIGIDHNEQNAKNHPVIEDEISSIPMTNPDSQPKIKEPSQDTFNSSHKQLDDNEINIAYVFFNWLIKGNIIAKVAIVILFLGLSYLFKYSIEHDYISPEIRILGALLLGIGLLAAGWKLRFKRQIYALILQGGAIAVLYLTIFAAYKLYELVPALLTFVFLVVICSTTILFAILQRAMSLAIIACVGGYVTPILLSDGSGNHIALFSYYLIISTAILVISITQSWRILNLLGFLFTFVVSLAWGINNFTAEFYIECQIFIFANLVIYGVLVVLLSVRSIYTEEYQNIIDMLLLFGAPLCGFGLQYAITRQWEFGPAFSSLGFGLFYLAGAYIILHKWKSLAKTISLFWLTIGVSFITFSIPLALSANWTALLWMFEGTALTWIMLTQKYYRVALFGALITSLGIISAVISLDDNKITLIMFTSLSGVSSIILFINACFWHYYGQKTEITRVIKLSYLSISIIVWTLWILLSTRLFLDQTPFEISLILLCATASLWLWYFIGRKINWNIMCNGMLLLWIALAVSLFMSHSESYYYLSEFWICSLAWIAAFTSCYVYLYKISSEKTNNNRLINNHVIFLHISLFWMLLGWLVRELIHIFDALPWGYEVIKWSLMATIACSIILLFYFLIKRQYITSFLLVKSYWTIGLLPLIGYIVYYLIAGLSMSGQIIYWSYIPIINPLEESAIFSLLMFSVWIKLMPNYVQFDNKTTNSGILNIPLPNLILVSLMTLTFLWGNSVVLRCLSQIFDITWNAYTLWHNNIVQMTASLLWMLSAVILIAIGHRYSLRKIWYSGQLIQITVIIKLIFVDIQETDGLLRAFAFIGVALLMLLIGYLAPIPPKQNDENIAENK
ncbi:DUF2339 domain-containing protein [Gilliamella apicola]|uniref:DUF2339 domain-containing protein n=1 Tax=Gilliamella apicola TaxID=1196095 RepID=UPI0015551A0C|nr:DUF2339 domain-containing protein [Gilliamella apicola]